jgi:hypothetical protein
MYEQTELTRIRMVEERSKAEMIMNILLAAKNGGYELEEEIDEFNYQPKGRKIWFKFKEVRSAQQEEIIEV